MKILEATGRSLDWMVALALDLSPIMKFESLAKSKMAYDLIGIKIEDYLEGVDDIPIIESDQGCVPLPYFCTDGSASVGLIDKFISELKTVNVEDEKYWVATANIGTKATCIGDTLLISAMRAFCSSLLPESVDVPMGLVNFDDTEDELIIEELV